MKKLIALSMGVALMAGVANADLLASWTEENDGTVANEAGTGVEVSDLSLVGGAANTSTAGDTWGMNALTEAGRGFQFSIVSIEDNQWIENAVVSGTARSSATGPAKMDWHINGTAVAGESITGIGTGDTAWQNTLGTLNEGDVVSLLVDLSAGTNRSGSDEEPFAAGTFRIRQGGSGGDFELSGDVIPEPGTLGLLALGAFGLAAVRRRMK